MKETNFKVALFNLYDKGMLTKDTKDVNNFWGYDLKAVFTHASHETAHFKHIVGENNFWGIKTPSRWDVILYNPALSEEQKQEAINKKEKNTQKYVKITTHEWVAGVRVKVKDSYFRDFETAEKALQFYNLLIRALYPESYANRANYKKFFANLVGHKYEWATDPNYVQKLFDLYGAIDF